MMKREEKIRKVDDTQYQNFLETEEIEMTGCTVTLLMSIMRLTEEGSEYFLQFIPELP